MRVGQALSSALRSCGVAGGRGLPRPTPRTRRRGRLGRSPPLACEVLPLRATGRIWSFYLVQCAKQRSRPRPSIVVLQMQKCKSVFIMEVSFINYAVFCTAKSTLPGREGHYSHDTKLLRQNWRRTSVSRRRHPSREDFPAPAKE